MKVINFIIAILLNTWTSKTNAVLAADAENSSSSTKTNSISENKKHRDEQSFLSLIGNAQLHHHPTFFDNVQGLLSHKSMTNDNPEEVAKNLQPGGRRLRTKKRNLTNKKTSKKSPVSHDDCDPADVQLLDYAQWQAEKGYWIGEYTFLKGDGNPFVSNSWNYPYDHYRGFITGEVVGNSYRQRNVFLYPPQVPSMCGEGNGDASKVVGDGVCGVNGNTKVFRADQSATTCSSNVELGGDIQGPYIQGNFVLHTTTELVGKDNALLYQVFIPGAILGKEEDVLIQSQLTTITENPDGQIYRTRTAQSFDAFVNIGTASSASFYRERKVEKSEFYATLKSTILEYNIRKKDLCVWDSSNNAIANVTGSFRTCKDHLEQSFDLGSE